jgi:hypothetical protein
MEGRNQEQGEGGVDEVARDIERFQLSNEGAYQPQKASSATPHTPPTGVELQKRIFVQNKRHASGGLQWIDEAELKKQRSVAVDVLRQLGQNILEGKDLTKIALPVYLFEPRSFLERLADGFSFAPHFLRKASECTDPIERLKYVIAFSVAGLHLTATQKKPFNPILGETHQAFFEDGTAVYCEQSSHHPPASNFQVLPPDSAFRLYGYGIFSAHWKGNVIHGLQKGPNLVEFPADGTVISIELPHAIFKGLIWGDRVQDYGGCLTFTDKKNDLACDLVFNPEAPGWVASWFTTAKHPSDWLSGDIYRMSTRTKTKKDVLAKVEGSWLSHLDVDGKRYWDLKEVAPWSIRPADDPLPSDCRYREDLQALLGGDEEEAQRLKVKLEEKQRREARLREEGNAARERKNSKPTSAHSSGGSKNSSARPSK